MKKDFNVMVKKRSPVGVSDFKTLITDDRYFIDKSLFIKDVVLGNDLLLFSRPRRFGKTLNLSMLKYFYDNSQDNSTLFSNLAISKEKDIMQKQGRHPVIFLTFKDENEKHADKCLSRFKMLIGKVYKEFEYILSSGILDKEETKCFKSIISGKADLPYFQNALKVLCEHIYKYHNTNPVILLDEYDTPIHSAFFHGYYDDLLSFMRIFLGSALKDNNYLEKAVLTGIFRVSKESMFSGLNNLTVCSLISNLSSDKFGFTQNEVEKALVDHDMQDKIDEVRDMYNGYNIGGNAIYNPWSLLNYIYEKRLDLYWINTSDNKLVKDLCKKADETVKQEIEVLIEGGAINKPINDNIIFSDLEDNSDALWNFLLMGGYLKYQNYHFDKKLQKSYADLTVPNIEISSMFRHDIIKRWLGRTDIKPNHLEGILHHLTDGEIKTFADTFTEFCKTSFSYYDVSGEEPERFYHAFVLGMLICLRDKYHIRSNRESGFGRYDVMLIPKNKNQRGIIFEFKKISKRRPETMEMALEDAKYQIIQMQYDQELISCGVSEIVNIIVVFDGKDMRLESF